MSSAKPVELSSRVRTHSNIVSPMSADKSVSVLLAQTAKYTDGKFIPDSSIHASASKRKDLSEYTGRYNHSATISALTNTMDKTRVLPFASPSRLNPTEALGRRVPSDDSAKKYEQRYSQQHEQQYIYNDEQFQQHPQQQINKQSEYKREGSSTRVSKDLEIYMKGMRNLGLTEESLSGLEELDLSFDEPNVSAQHPYSTHSVSNMHSSRAKEYYQQEEQGSNDFSHSNLDVLEAMDYYSTNSGVLPVGSNRVTH